MKQLYTVTNIDKSERRFRNRGEWTSLEPKKFIVTDCPPKGIAVFKVEKYEKEKPVPKRAIKKETKEDENGR